MITDAELDDPGPRILYANFGFEAMTGYTPGEVIGKTPRILQGPETDRRVLDRLRRQLSAGEAFFGEVINYTKDGTPFWIEWHVSPIRDDAGRITNFVALQRDVTERKRAEFELREREQTLRLITDSLPALIAAVDRDRIFRFANRALARRLERRRSEIVGRSVADVLGTRLCGALLPYFDRAFAGECVSFEHESTHPKDGSTEMGLHHYVPRIEGDGRVDTVYCLETDVTQLKRAEKERLELETKLQQAQRLESLGVFASGIAHDFNNVLAAILGQTSVSLRQLDPTSSHAEGLREIEAAAQRGAELVSGILDYVAPTKLITELTDLRSLVESMSKLLEACCSARVELRYDLEPSAPPIRAAPTELRQILMNLVTNASESLRDRSGSIHVRIGALDLDRKGLDGLLFGEGLPTGAYGFLEVSDDGPGVPEDLRERIFDPYFSTKISGRGLGLAIVLGVVRSHGGAIDLETSPGSGTRFRALFPASVAVAGERSVPSADTVPRLPTGTVLFVDDEAAIRRLATRALESLGLRALTAADAEEALDLLRGSQDSVQAIVLDLTMPGLASEDAITALRALRPETPILMTSGFSSAGVQTLLAREGVAGFLQKPFSLDQLATALGSAFGVGRVTDG